MPRLRERALVFYHCHWSSQPQPKVAQSGQTPLGFVAQLSGACVSDTGRGRLTAKDGHVPGRQPPKQAAGGMWPAEGPPGS